MSVDKRSKRCQQFLDDRHLLRTIRGGTKAMHAAGQLYLPKEPAESHTAYLTRLKRSVLTNFVKRAVKNLASKPFVRPIVVESDKHQEIADEYMKAVDGRGTSLTGLCGKVFEDALWQGTSFIAVDAPAGGGKPYAYMLSGDSILGYQLDEDDSLIEIRIAEKITVQDADYLEKEVGRVRVFRKEGDKVTWDLYEEGKSGGYSVVLKDQSFGLNQIPIQPIHCAPLEASGDLFSPAPLEDMAHLNLQHYQESSDQQNILHVARVPVLFASGFPEDTKIKIGAEVAIVGGEGSSLAYVEHSGQAITAGRQSIVDIEHAMASYGAEMLQNTGAVETATGRALKAGENNNQIAMLATSMAAGVEQVLTWLAQFNRISEPQFSVDIHTDYGITASNEELTALKDARMLGDLSRQDYLSELRRRGILTHDFNTQDNQDRLATEYT